MSSIFHTNPKIHFFMHDILCIDFFTEDYCKFLISEAESKDAYANNPFVRNKVKETFLFDVNEDIVFQMFQFWDRHILPIYNSSFLFNDNSWFLGWKFPVFKKVTKEFQPEKTLVYRTDSLLSSCVKLNSGYYGGEMIFPKQSVDSSKAPIGSIIVWPSSIQHIYFTNEVVSGTKYCISTETKINSDDIGINLSELYKN